MSRIIQYYLSRFDETYASYNSVIHITPFKEKGIQYYGKYKRRMLRSLKSIQKDSEEILQLQFQYYIFKLSKKLERIYGHQLKYKIENNSS